MFDEPNYQDHGRPTSLHLVDVVRGQVQEEIQGENGLVGLL